MNCLLLPIDNFVNADATSAQAYISDPKQIDHIHKVLGLQVGDSLKIGQLGGKLGSAIIDDMTPTAIQLREVQLTLAPPNKLDAIPEPPPSIAICSPCVGSPGFSLLKEPSIPPVKAPAAGPYIAPTIGAA